MKKKSTPKSGTTKSREYQLRKNALGRCGIHPERPLAPTSKTVCQECLIERRDRYRRIHQSKGHPTIWEKIKRGKPTSLSKKDCLELQEELSRLSQAFDEGEGEEVGV